MKCHAAAALLAACLLVPTVGCGPPVVVEDDLPKLQGEWVVVEFNQYGKTADAKRLANMNVSINGTQFNEVEANGPKLVNADFTTLRLDTTKAPREIEFVGTRGADQGKTRLGVYALEDDRLKICVADFGTARPADFVGRDKVTLYVLKRKKPDPQ